MRLIVSLLLWGISSFYAASAYVAPAAASDGTPFTVELGKRYSLHSEILGEERQVLVRLPNGYDSDDASTRYPVIYLLDGDNHFVHGSAGAAILERTQRMPESIIIALPNNPGTRERDLAFEKDNFTRFIDNELFAFVDANYHTSGHRTLFGHSLAGYFTLSILADHHQMFDNYIAASPSVLSFGSELVGKFEHLFTESTMNNKSLFFTVTEAAEDGQDRTDALNLMAASLEKRAPESFKWRYNFIGEQVHRTTPFLTVFQGLSYVFSDYQAPSYISSQAFDDAGGLAALNAFFARRAEKYGVEEGVPQATLRQIAYLYSSEGLHKQAVTFFKKNVQKYPERPRVYNSLGDGYAEAGQFGLALEAYQRAVNLAEEQGDEDVDWFTRNLQRLEARMAQE